MPRSFIEGQAAYVNLLSAEGSTYARGIVVEWTPESVVVAVDPAPLRREPQMEVGSTPIVFVKVTAASLHAARPEGWEEVRALQPWPDPRLVVEAFNSSDGRADQVETESDMQSAAETVTQPATKASSAALSFLERRFTIAGFVLRALTIRTCYCTPHKCVQIFFKEFWILKRQL